MRKVLFFALLVFFSIHSISQVVTKQRSILVESRVKSDIPSSVNEPLVIGSDLIKIEKGNTILLEPYLEKTGNRSSFLKTVLKAVGVGALTYEVVTRLVPKKITQNSRAQQLKKQCFLQLVSVWPQQHLI